MQYLELYRIDIMFNKTFTLSTLILVLLIAGCSNSVGPVSEVIPTTNFGFQLAEPSHVKIWVENNYRTEVVTVLNDYRQAGSHNVSVEMKDIDGIRLPNGLYTILIKTDSFENSYPLLLY